MGGRSQWFTKTDLVLVVTQPLTQELYNLISTHTNILVKKIILNIVQNLKLCLYLLYITSAINFGQCIGEL